MPVTKSESITAKLLGNTFLNMYVRCNPQIQVNGMSNAVELCDVLISFYNMAILIEVKGFNEKIGHSEPADWFFNKVQSHARSQLSKRRDYLMKPHKVFDKETKAPIPTHNWEAIMMVIVFDRDSVENYSYTRVLEDETYFCGVNIFSMTDFRLATESIPTPLDFFMYLQERYITLSKRKHLFPVVVTPINVYYLSMDKITDEKIMIADYLLKNTKNYDGNVEPARKIMTLGEQLCKINYDSDLLATLSCINLITAAEIYDIAKDLSLKNGDKELSWNGQFVQSGIKDGKIGIAVCYAKRPSILEATIEKFRLAAIENAGTCGIETIFAMVFFPCNKCLITKIR